MRLSKGIYRLDTLRGYDLALLWTPVAVWTIADKYHMCIHMMLSQSIEAMRWSLNKIANQRPHWYSRKRSRMRTAQIHHVVMNGCNDGMRRAMTHVCDRITTKMTCSRVSSASPGHQTSHRLVRALYQQQERWDEAPGWGVNKQGREKCKTLDEVFPHLPKNELGTNEKGANPRRVVLRTFGTVFYGVRSRSAHSQSRASGCSQDLIPSLFNIRKMSRGRVYDYSRS
jgi:hypothetical protein